MTDFRKRLQNKLRRKFKYFTDPDHGRGVILGKECDDNIDFTVSISGNGVVRGNNNAIDLYLMKYADKDSTDIDNELSVAISYEELESIYFIAQELRKERTADI